MSDQSGALIRRKIKAADGRKPDDAVIEFAEHLTSKINESLVFEPRFIFSARYHDAEVTSLKGLFGELPNKSLYCFTDDFLFHLDNQLTHYWIEAGLAGENETVSDATTYSPTAIDTVLSRPLFECIASPLKKALPVYADKSENEIFRQMEIERHIDNVHFMDDASKVVVICFAFGEEGMEPMHARLALPVTMVEEITANTKPRQIEDISSQGIWSSHLHNEAMHLPLTLHAVINRAQLTVDEISKFEPGQLLAFSQESLEQIQLSVSNGKETRPIAIGQLGRHQTQKAIKLVEDPDHRMTSLLSLTE
ncbi:MAG: FliM/FliN family flagellar motor switch protein [Pseudomonadota bacterium]